MTHHLENAVSSLSARDGYEPGPTTLLAISRLTDAFVIGLRHAVADWSEGPAASGRQETVSTFKPFEALQSLLKK